MSEDLYEQGLKIRRQVMGDAYVDRALASADEFSAEMQKLVTETAWGRVWSRPGLDRKTRSLLNLAMLPALNRMHEFRGHVRGAVNNGCTEDEIREALLQVAIYCGMPAALEAFRNAREVLDEMAAEN
jgi:4-carboxymuconolactone decarboxylase